MIVLSKHRSALGFVKIVCQPTEKKRKEKKQVDIQTLDDMKEVVVASIFSGGCGVLTS